MSETNSNSKPSQCDRVLAYMEKHGSITPMDALMDLGVMRLASRISEIVNKRGINIEKNMIPVNNRFGEKCHVMAYSIAK